MTNPNWQYGEEGARWDVQPGDVWQVGRHLVACGDISKGDTDRFLALAREQNLVPSLVYSDPPWNQGNVNSFRTKAGVERDTQKFFEFLIRLGRLYAESGATNLVIEMGKQHVADLQTALVAAGFTILGVDAGTYYRKHPMYYVRAVKGMLHTALNHMVLTGIDDEEGPRFILSRLPKNIVVFDPCLGRGLTLRSAHAFGHTCIGTELHPRRLSVAIDRLVTLDPSLTPTRLTANVR